MSRVVVLGASGLIGTEIARHLAAEGHEVVAVARGARRGPGDVEAVSAPFVDLGVDALAALLAAHRPGMVVNCTGVLQGADTGEVHHAFVERLIAACAALDPPPRLVHLSIPGDGADDATAFARTKRAAEDAIRASGLDHAILRPGFVIAGAAYGGSALVRALAASPFGMPRDDGSRPFAPVAASDIARTADWLARHEGPLAATWDLLHPAPSTLDGVVEAHRAWIGGPPARIALPGWLTTPGAWFSDLAGRLGWRPPTRSTALAELRRGIAGDPGPWIEATGIAPLDAASALAQRPASVADRWFARLYPLKAAVIAILALFWIVSGLVALASYDEARAILVGAGFPAALSHAVTWTTSLADIAIGLLIAHRRTARAGLWNGIALSLLYLASASVLTPLLWLDPVGSLVKTVPAVVLMIVALAMLDDR